MEDYVSAAARHWDNAQFLADDNRWQEAAYLAGYVAECAAKALLERTAPGVLLRQLGHDLVALTGEALEMAMLLNPASRRYPVASVLPGGLGVSQWRPEHRYEPTGFLPEADFRQIIVEGQEIGQSILLGLVLDGHIEEIPQ